MNELMKNQIENWNKNLDILQNELEHSSSDRSCVIVAAAYLDDVLRYLLRAFLSSPTRKNEDNELFSGFGPLSTFSSKALLSFRLGLISDYEYRALQVVRKIRNAFAHSISTESLSEFRDLLIPIIPPRQLLLIKSIPLSSGSEEPPLPIVPSIDETSHRDVFMKVVLCLTNLLSARCAIALSNRRETPNNYSSLVEIDDDRISRLQKCLDDLDTLLKLELESRDLHNKMITQLSSKEGTENSEEIKRHQAEIEKLDKDIAENYEEFKEYDSIMSLSKYARDRIKKAFDEQLS